MEKILDKYNFLCINIKKEKIYYRAFDCNKLTINLTVASLTIAPELEWSKKYELGGSDHFSIIIEEEREISMKQQQRRSTGKANWMQFQKESTITTKYRTKTQPKKHLAA